MKKEILFKKTSKYISITAYLIARLRFSDINQKVSYLELDIPFVDFGKEIRAKLSESKEVADEVFMYYYNHLEEMRKFTQHEEKKVMETYGYKNKTSLYKDTIFLIIKVNNDMLYIEPCHNYSLGSFTSVKDENKKAIKFEYPLTISDEELGKATMEAFEYCTSIYR
ncbi:uncharacterized protein DUF1436 [Bisgaardia hudsonensis]|uniref:Uncharacterized protein DUF1436 n=1 Tax=Bisgaardia hudsonensis TaxID=109472 RepID=A0A4R2N1U1_9PAST|nr:contact-dependent growth inhibition system immunity protein [Bisgaardia hudsonensis]QLB12914.1 hypothetical protein A6A11_04475 [Bisgaardia hudsonensis]TCP13529.1 uncharacterized protein DUF1436 [Bisgaardia hudsonensis]